MTSHSVTRLTSTTMKARAKDSKAKVSKRKMRSILMRWRAKLGAYPAKDLLPIVRYSKDKSNCQAIEVGKEVGKGRKSRSLCCWKLVENIVLVNKLNQYENKCSFRKILFFLWRQKVLFQWMTQNLNLYILSRLRFILLLYSSWNINLLQRFEQDNKPMGME